MKPDSKISPWFSIPLLGILFFHLVSESMVIPILEPTLANPKSQWDMLPGASEAAHKFMFGFGLSVYPIVVFICAPIIGALSDRLGRRPILLASMFVAAAGSFGQGLGMEFLSLPLFLMGRILVGASAGVDGVIQAALLDKSKSAKQKNFYLGATLLAMSLGLMLGPAFAAIGIRKDSDIFTWSIPFFVLVAIFAALIPVVVKNMPPDASRKRIKIREIDWFSGIRDIAMLKRTKDARALLAMFILSQLANGCFTATIPLILTSTFEFGVRRLAVFLSVEGVFAGVVFAIIGPRILARFSKKSALRFSMLMCLVSVLYPLVENEIFIWTLTFVQALGFALSYYVMLAIFSEATDQSKRGWILSVLSSMWGLTTGLGLLLCGIAASISNAAALFTCIALAAASFCLSLTKMKKSDIRIE